MLMVINRPDIAIQSRNFDTKAKSVPGLTR
jgi:hypothetical protein